MPGQKLSPFDSSSRRLAVYGYLAPLVAGRRVIEVGAGTGAGSARLLALGASGVLGVDADQQAIARARATHRGAGLDFRVLERRVFDSAATGGFELVVVPDGAAVLRPGGVVTPAALRGLCGEQGTLALLVASSDRTAESGKDGAGVGYYEVVEALERLFPRVRMFGLTPFAAFGLAEFSETPAGLRIDGGLVDEAGEQPTHYLAVAGPDDDFDLGYALMQIPAESAGVEPPRERVPEARELAELRERLADAEGKAEGLLRVSRAQTEEIEELRARLRRGAEAREELDQEVGRLRRALTEADASVLDLTRRTTQEMASLAQRITAGLRPEIEGRDEAGAIGRLREELRTREEELAAAESALSERDERVATLEAERQDLEWRLSAAEASVGQGAAAPAVASIDDGAAQRQRELALEQYRQAAAAHLDEVGRLREALAEQSTLVAELEDALSASGRRLASTLEETEKLRRHNAEIEEADRTRRSRLAEVEGTLLRLQRQTAMTAAAPTSAPNGTVSSADWERKLATALAEKVEAERRLVNAEEKLAAAAEAQRKLAALEAKLAKVEGELREVDGRRDVAERRWSEAVEKVVGLEKAMAEGRNGRSEEKAPLGVADGPRLETALREISRLREMLERSEEQLWETKGQLLLDRERMAVLENQLAAAPTEPIVTEAAHQAIMNAVYKELSSMEKGVRAEIARVERIERTVEGWRKDDPEAGGATVVTGSFTPIE
jgi:chromosome segregation ATPase